ncbi:expressed unknown protein [Seminavis robusta]|uniref:Sulfotransferase domain-containing protein n=1 Tax=Seminavis robusta TaxID=568900 RepID=A0A9N8HA70_9STRA|nr:expressed unknown protein [Seminavis robusta]|eukprot:Sro307_g113440.1 n/a (606) ;mRNA; f:67889-69706
MNDKGGRRAHYRYLWSIGATVAALALLNYGIATVMVIDEKQSRQKGMMPHSLLMPKQKGAMTKTPHKEQRTSDAPYPGRQLASAVQADKLVLHKTTSAKSFGMKEKIARAATVVNGTKSTETTEKQSGTRKKIADNAKTTTKTTDADNNNKNATTERKVNVISGHEGAPNLKHSALEQVRPLDYYMDLSRKEGHDKERILQLLQKNAKIRHLSDATYQELPSWTEVTSLYGSEPRLMGTDQCAAFKAGKEEDLAEKWLGVAGMFNTGTNLLADTLKMNCVLHKKQKKYGNKYSGVRAQMTYGKHTPPKDEQFRMSHIIPGQKNIDPRQELPVVMVRDPFRWLQSMCVNYYSSHWPRPYRPSDKRYHCPNLYPTEEEKKKLWFRRYEPILDGTPIVKEKNEVSHSEGVFMDKQFRMGGKKPGKWIGPPQGTTPPPEILVNQEPTTLLTDSELSNHSFPVHVVYANFTRYHYSLVHLFNDWYREYFDLKDYPHVFIRFEDLLYFPDQVVTHICECAGGKLKLGNLLPVRIPSQSTKQSHKSRVVGGSKLQHTGYLDAIIKYGRPATRFRGMTSHDLQYANHYLDEELMEHFGYGLAPHPQSPVQPKT